MNYELTQRMKAFAFAHGADLVGVANIERFKNAPIMMSPQGIMPKARSVIVCAVHHPDAAIELGGEPEPQDIGPYSIQYIMNDRLDMLSYQIANELDREGYGAIPIASSNIWRYRAYKELDAVFAPDMSHIYSAVAAGLSELGWNGLSITPEFGARNRFISIITEAELEPSPLYSGEKLCDMCGECIKNCPTDAYRKEVKGVNNVVIDGKDHKFANKNLWRCAWGEHFDLDLNLEIPEVVDEAAIIKNVKEHGMRGGEFGVCLRVCLPKPLRVSDPGYTRVYRRKRHAVATDLSMSRGLLDRAAVNASRWNIDYCCQISGETLESNRVDIKKYLPDGCSVLLLADACKVPPTADKQGYRSIANFNLHFCAYDIVREWENMGYTAMSQSAIDCKKLAELAGLETEDEMQYEAILCSGKMEDAVRNCKKSGELRKPLEQLVQKWAKEAGADLVGISPANRVDEIASQLSKIKGGETLYAVRDKKPRFYQYDPEIEAYERRIKNTEDHVPGAKNVIVLGLHYPAPVVERTAKEPAEAVGPYVFVQYESQRMLGHMAYALVKHLQGLGYEAVYSFDALNIGTKVGSPRGPLYGPTCGSLEAVAAGIAVPSFNGRAVTEAYGINQNFVAIVTDAPMEADALLDFGQVQDTCSGCRRCIEQCPMGAIRMEQGGLIRVEDRAFRYGFIDGSKCEWASLHALVGADGFQYIGSTQDERPETVTPALLAQALQRKDPIQKYRPVTAEACVLSCPFARAQEDE